MRFAMLIVTGMLCVGLSLAVAQEGTAKKLVGSWIVTKGNAPPNAVLTFTKDGKMALTADLQGKELRLEGTYTLKDNEITSRLNFAGKEMVEVHKIKKLTETELHTEDEKGAVDEFKKK
jgi:uncharacterized protein (TIGR03066 family)